MWGREDVTGRRLAKALNAGHGGYNVGHGRFEERKGHRKERPKEESEWMEGWVEGWKKGEVGGLYAEGVTTQLVSIHTKEA
jgi:hypothetical protein